MFRHHYILPVLLAMFLAASCDFNKKEKAMRLSSELSFINDSLFYYGKTWNDELKVAVNLSDYSKLKFIRQDLENYIDRKSEYIRNMEDVGGSEELRKAELEYLAFEKQVVRSKFTPFEQFDTSTSAETLAAAYENLLSSMEDEKPKLENFQKQQEAYAEKNDFPKPIRELE